jgi:hypothetical protein
LLGFKKHREGVYSFSLNLVTAKYVLIGVAVALVVLMAYAWR